MDHSPEITTLLLNWRDGDQGAGEQLLAAVYDELHRLAARYLRAERPDHTLQPTAMVNELYLRVFVSAEPPNWQNRAHFFAVAARTLRRILLDHARTHLAQKRGGKQVKVPLTAVTDWAQTSLEELAAIDEALQHLEQLDARAARVVDLRFFGGLQEDEIAEVLGVSIITIKRDWKFARAWLMSQLTPQGAHPQPGGARQRR